MNMKTDPYRKLPEPEFFSNEYEALQILTFSRGRTHDLFDRWNHVKLCLGFLFFGITHLFFLLLDDPAFLLHCHNNWYQKHIQFVLTEPLSFYSLKEKINKLALNTLKK